MQIGVETSRAVENKRVFVVDSDEISRAVLQFMLHDENETHELASLEDAFAKGRERLPDLVLLGLAMVREHGVGAVGDVAERFPGAKLLLVAETAADPLVQTSLKAGAHAVLTKPLTVESVRHKVDILLGRRVPMVVPLTVLTTAAKK